MIGTRHAVLLTALALLAVASLAIALVVGSVAIPPLKVLDALQQTPPPLGLVLLLCRARRQRQAH